MTDDRAERFRALFARTYPDVLRFVQRRAHPSHAEDVAAETFLVAWRRLDDIPAGPQACRAWLFGTARRCLLNARRGADRQAALAVRIAGAAPPGTIAEPDGLADRLDLVAAWGRLSPTDQEVLALAVWEDLPSPEAGQVLGISGGAYRLRLSRARRALTRALADPDPRPARDPHAQEQPS